MEWLRENCQNFDIAVAANLIDGVVCTITDTASKGDGRRLFHFNPAQSKKQLIECYAETAIVSARSCARFSTQEATQLTKEEECSRSS